jgi:hypothetical protein
MLSWSVDALGKHANACSGFLTTIEFKWERGRVSVIEG